MNIVSVCRSCGRTKNKQFVYCPWCGTSSTDGKNYGQMIDADYDEKRLSYDEVTFARINMLENSLEQLEKELNHIVSLHEVHSGE